MLKQPITTVNENMCLGEYVRKTPDWFKLSSLLVLLIVSVTVLEYYLPRPWGDALSRGTITGLVATLAFVSYRYSVKSNIRSSVDELEPLIVGNYRIVPTVRDVKWRPQVLRQFSKQCSIIPTPATTILFNLHLKERQSEEVNQLADMEEFLNERDINCESFGCSADEVFSIPEADAPVSNLEIMDCRINTEGLHFQCDSVTGVEIRTFADRVLRKLGEEI